MPDPREPAPPVSALRHPAARRGRRDAAVNMLVVYVVLLFAVPSEITLGGLGALGKPALLWGLFLLIWWFLHRLQARGSDVPPVKHAVLFAVGLFVVVVLIAFAAAMLRGQPADQISPAVTALLRLASWVGVLLVTMDGVRTQTDARRLIRVLVVAGGALAALGLAQFFSGQSFLDWMLSLPGVSSDGAVIDTRGGFSRASGTATHPLEYATSLAATLPLALVTAIAGGFSPSGRRHFVLWWVPVVLITTSSLVSVSRSAIVGVVVAVVASLPALPLRYRWVVGFGGVALALGVAVAVPGIFTTMVSLFAGAAEDPSTQSRTTALARVPEFIASSPVIGQGFGVFLPRYYIFDNQWVLLTVETGVLGVAVFALLVVTSVASAIRARIQSPFEDTKAMSTALAASMATITVLFFFFDGLSFPISAGLFFLIAGMCASMRTLSAADASVARAGRGAPEPRGLGSIDQEVG